MSNPPPLPTEGQQPVPLGYATPRDGLPCPRCHQLAAKPVTFSWWGGLLGPKLLHHTKCAACGYTFNRKTGRPNTTAITIYLVVGVVIGIGVGVLFVLMR